MSNDDIEWREKYEASEKNLQYLKTLSHNAIADYEALQHMHNENQGQYEELKKRLFDTEEKLHNLQNALEPACDEYNRLCTNFEIEKACRTEAECFASKVNKEKNKLKRQSQMLLQKLGNTDIDILKTIEDESEPTAEDSATDDRQALNDKIRALEEEIKLLEDKLGLAESNLTATVQAEKKKCSRLESELLKVCKQLEQHEHAVENFKRTSVLAWGEFSELKDKYEQETMLKKVAEQYAHQMVMEREAMKRQSTVLMTAAASDGKLMQALLEIETLTKQLETEKNENKKKIKSLEETIEALGNAAKVEGMQGELQMATSEVERLHKAIEEMEQWKQTMITENEELTKQFEATKSPPPPPPPPPPPCPPPFIRPTALVIIKKSPDSMTDPKNPKTPSNSKEQLHFDALQEMMNRITSGKPILASNKSISRATSTKYEAKPVVSPMNELQKILQTMKPKQEGVARHESESGVHGPVKPKQESVSRHESESRVHSPVKTTRPSPPPVQPKRGPRRSSADSITPITPSTIFSKQPINGAAMPTLSTQNPAVRKTPTFTGPRPSDIRNHNKQPADNSGTRM